MNAKQLARRLEALSMRVWQETIRLERLCEQASKHAEDCADLSIPCNGDFDRKSSIQEDATKQLKALFWTLNGIQDSLSEASETIDSIADLVDEITPPARAAKPYDPPDEWK